MLFILNKAGVPSTAKMIRIRAATPSVALSAASLVDAKSSEAGAYTRIYEHEARVAGAAKGMAVIIGITGTCPYGIGACWGGAYEALCHLQDVDLVSPVPNAGNSTAEVFLKDDCLPALARWGEQFRSIVNGTYEIRGVEVTLHGVIYEQNGVLFLLTGGAARVSPVGTSTCVR